MATINYNSGNINVSFFPGNTNPIWFCDKNTGGINIATNGAAIATNTLKLGYSGTTTILSGTVKADTITSTISANVLNIGNEQRSSDIKIGSGGIRGNGTYIGVRIADGSNDDYGYLSLGSETLGNTYLRSKYVYINETPTSGNTFIGNTTIGYTTIKGKAITQVVPLVGGGTVQTVIGDSNNETSLSTTFNRKQTPNIGGSSLDPIPCYYIGLTAYTWTCQYFEILVSGSNRGCGGYTYKGCFSINNTGNVGTVISSVNTLFFSVASQVGQPQASPLITFSTSGATITLYIKTGNIISSNGASNNQNFISTLIAYPTLSLDNGLFDSTVTAVPNAT